MEVFITFLIFYLIPATSVSITCYLLEGKLDENAKSLSFVPMINFIAFGVILICLPFKLGHYFFQNYKINWREL